MDPDALDGVERAVHAGTADPDLLDFTATVNPTRPSGVAAVYDSALAASHRYPADDYAAFRAAAADYVGCPAEGVVPAAGGLAGVRLAFDVALEPDDSALVPSPSFDEYAREVRMRGATPEFVPHDDLLDADPAGHALAVVATPNNPTGDAADAADLRAFADRCRDAGTLFVVDETFLDFADRPSMAGTEGVAVARSLGTTFGLPGLRAGFLVAAGRLRDRLETARPAWGLSTPAALVGEHCLGETGFVADSRDRVRSERDRLRVALEPAYGVGPSEAPFLLLDTRERDPAAVVRHARDRGVVVRDATTFRGLDGHVRVAVGRPDDNDRLLRALPGLDPRT
ncbi:aminotransferase class I/II-fold pyridoxal phosphate-dependent enzyme [Candidatus Halobonum tyrrellensis]|uniref:L-threonine-O-3-phosphate decarboxylase n=1 Tax=Candidatus Halobonum tyrrellensis G22 TaxID=1324957 RepID=V4IYC1_9EURY|nr:aminotransferase class I/II-fold pyridoxal phosphate-dependent enzyme [Candidatus Halobonum tyrrellensis]ESP88147.1 L-threonine-O-3-phosphate decarboxylase [Candidatus Halobonum tyrrellensis G22]